MTDKIRIYVDGVPGSKGRPQFARTSSGVRTFSRPKTISYEKRLQDIGRAAWPHPVLTCPLRLQIIAVFPITASWPKWKREMAANGELWHVGKPDLDNIIKIACDGLNDVIWRDDAQICETSARKQYGVTSGLWLTIEPLQENLN